MVLRHCYCPLRIHTPYVTPYETRSMRALAALRMVWASAAWMAVEMLATWCVRKLRGDASGDRLSVAPGRRVWRARRRRMVMNEAASAPVVSATRRETPTPLERASAYCPLHAATKLAPVTRS